MVAVFIKHLDSQTNKNMTMIAYKELLETCIKLAISPHSALQPVQEAIHDMYSSLILPQKCPRTNSNIINT